MSVAPATGRMLFSVFEDQGYAIYGLDSSRTHGEPVVLGAAVASASILPPGDTPGRATVTQYLHDPLTGLAAGTDFVSLPYHSSFSLDAIGQPQLGVSAGGPFAGTDIGVLPPTINLDEQDPEIQLNVVTGEHQKLPDGDIAALNNSFGFGGHNVALAIRSF